MRKKKRKCNINDKPTCMQCRTREVWLNYGLCYECYMKKTDKNGPSEPKRESYTILELPGKRVKVNKKN